MLKRISTFILVAVATFVASLSPQSAPAQQSLVDKVITLTAPTGGVVKDSPYVVQNIFVVAAETKAEGQQFAALSGVLRNGNSRILFRYRHLPRQLIR